MAQLMAQESWREAAGRPVRELAAGTAATGLPEVVLVPGLGIVATMLPLLAACARFTRARLLDLPGFGSAPAARLPARLPELTGVAAACLPERPAPPVVLLGHSTGAQLALRAAAAAPERVAGLVLVGLTFTPAVRADHLRLLPQLRAYLHERPQELVVAGPDLARGRGRVVQYLRTSLPDPPEPHLAALTCPVVLLRGRLDALSPAPFAASVAALARDGAAHGLPGSHNVVWTHPAAVALHVEALARRVAAPRVGEAAQTGELEGVTPDGVLPDPAAS